MRVLFVYPDFYVHKHGDGRIRYEPAGWYNEGLASLSAALKQRGHETALLHLLCPPAKEHFQAQLRRQCPDLVAFSLRSEVFRIGAVCAQWAKEMGYPTIAGGCHPTLAPEESLSAPGLDIICRGEGEVALAELCDRLEAGRDPYDIPSLWFKRGDQVIANPVGEVVQDLDLLPIPDYSLFDLPGLTSGQTYTALASFTRGCPYNCTYCCNQILRSIYPNRNRWLRTRSPQNAIACLQALKAAYPQVRYLRINDDIFHWSEEWLEEFAHLYKAQFTMPLAVHHRPNLFTERMARLLREIGCYQIYFGVESGNEYIRNAVLRRRMSNQEIERAFALAHQAGMITTAYNMVGLPYETMERALDTIKLNARIGAERILNPIYCPYPHTDLYDLAVEAGFCPPNIGYEEEAICSMPGYEADKVRFVSANFKAFVGAYRAAYRLPRALGQRAERLLDRLFLWPRLPHRLLARLAYARQRAAVRGKSLLRRTMPGLYIFLRDLALGRHA